MDNFFCDAVAATIGGEVAVGVEVAVEAVTVEVIGVVVAIVALEVEAAGRGATLVGGLRFGRRFERCLVPGMVEFAREHRSIAQLPALSHVVTSRVTMVTSENLAAHWPILQFFRLHQSISRIASTPGTKNAVLHMLVRTLGLIQCSNVIGNSF